MNQSITNTDIFHCCDMFFLSFSAINNEHYLICKSTWSARSSYSVLLLPLICPKDLLFWISISFLL